MKYFDYTVDMDHDGLRVSDPDMPDYLSFEHCFSNHGWLPGTTFYLAEHPLGGVYLKRIDPAKDDDINV